MIIHLYYKSEILYFDSKLFNLTKRLTLCFAVVTKSHDKKLFLNMKISWKKIPMWSVSMNKWIIIDDRSTCPRLYLEKRRKTEFIPQSVMQIYWVLHHKREHLATRISGGFAVGLKIFPPSNKTLHCFFYHNILYDTQWRYFDSKFTFCCMNSACFPLTLVNHPNTWIIVYRLIDAVLISIFLHYL